MRFTDNRHYCDKPLAFSQNTPDFSDLLSRAFGRKAAAYTINPSENYSVFALFVYVRAFRCQMPSGADISIFSEDSIMKITKKTACIGYRFRRALLDDELCRFGRYTRNYCAFLAARR